jgi:twinkle protein
VIVEGECDKLALDVAGISNAVSVPDGAPPAGSKPSETKFEYLVNCAAQLDPLKKIVLAVDNDPPGKTLEEELARRLGPERCWRVTWPDGCKDANDVLLLHGPTALADYITDAKPVPLDGVFTVADLADDVMSLYREGLRGGVSTGWCSVDKHYTVRPGELTIVTGVPSHGKSQFLDALLVNLAREHDWTFGICSPENLPVARHVAKLIEQYTGWPFREGPTQRLPKDELIPSLEWLHQHFCFIAPEESLTVGGLLDKGKSLFTRHGIRGLVVDPWNEFDHTRTSGQTETEHICNSLTQIRRFAPMGPYLAGRTSAKTYRKDDGTPRSPPYDISGLHIGGTRPTASPRSEMKTNLSNRCAVCPEGAVSRSWNRRRSSCVGTR